MEQLLEWIRPDFFQHAPQIVYRADFRDAFLFQCHDKFDRVEGVRSVHYLVKNRAIVQPVRWLHGSRSDGRTQAIAHQDERVIHAVILPDVQVLINALTGEVGFNTQMSGYPTTQELRLFPAHTEPIYPFITLIAN
jgi:hypothetical protein